MGSWQQELQLSDLPAGQMLEVACKKCGGTHYEDPALLIERYGLHFAYVDEAAKVLACHRHGCTGEVRLALSASSEAEGFVGGLA